MLVLSEFILRLGFGLALSMLLVSHNLGIVGRLCDRLTILYAGRAVESGPTAAVLATPRHPYTRGLLGATPSAVRRRGGRLVEIAGSVPALSDLPVGCAFQNRCPDVFDRCRAGRPILAPLLPHRSAACFAAEEEVSRHVAAVGT